MGLFGIASFQKPSQATNANPILLSPCLYLPSRFALPLLCLFPPAPSLWCALSLPLSVLPAQCPCSLTLPLLPFVPLLYTLQIPISCLLNTHPQSAFSCQSLRAWHFYCRLCKVPICQEITFNFRSVPSINRSRVDILALRRWRECIDTRPALTYNNRTSQPQAESAHQQGTPPKLVPRHTNLKKGLRHWTMIL